MRGERIWAEVNLAAIEHNLRTIRAHLMPGTRILGVVKADAYGHGALSVAHCLLASGCSMLGVGDSSEALELREGGITAPILILGAIVEDEIPRVVENDIAVTIHSVDLVSRLEEEARRHGRRLRVHLKIDTGMSRLGVSPRRAGIVARRILSSPPLVLEGVSTHIATRDAGTTGEQLARFRAALRAFDLTPPLVHAANSVTLFRNPDSHFGMVRPGIALYGMDPGELARYDLRPALSLRTRIAFLKWLPPGAGIGYDHRFVTSRRTRLATCPVGYNDGYPHQLSNRSWALLHGHRIPLIGTVTMDYIMLDVTDVENVQVGDEVTLIGRSGTEQIRVEDLARRVGTIPYAIPCGLGRRVKRVYVREEVGSRPVPAGRTVA